MPSIFAFYRARGISGAYVVGIQLDLMTTESARVGVVSRSGPGHYGQQEPIKKGAHQEGYYRHVYRIEQLVIGDIITIQINDHQLLPCQTTVYTATRSGFTETEVPFRLWQHETQSNHDFGVISLNPITVIDLDKEDIVIQQSSQIVDAAPVKPVRRKRHRKKKAPHLPYDNDHQQLPDLEDPTFQF